MDSHSTKELTGAERERERARRLLADAKATADPKLRELFLAEALKLAQLAATLEAAARGH